MPRLGLIPLLLALLALLPLASAPVQAQDRAALIADAINLLPGGALRAEGNVEVLFQGMRLRARAITFDKTRDTLTIDGPLSLSDQDGNQIFLADAGALSGDFRNGILRSARMVLDQQLQIAGSELSRVDGRYTHLFQAVATSCSVCAATDVPLWQIRASRVTHDQIARRIYYENAIFEVSGLPVFYLPRMSMPDASVTRASGFLIPRVKTNSVLGTGIELPYFQTLGDHADLLATPYLAARSKTVALRYRQLLQTGAIRLEGAVSKDDVLGQDYRAYLFGSGIFFLPRDYELRFDLETASDERYLFDYGISNQDRLRNSVALSRTRPNTYFNARIDGYRSFRDTEAGGTSPSQIGLVDYVRQYRPGLIGGRAQVRLQSHGLVRDSDADVTGRDYRRFSAGLDWRDAYVFGPGLRLASAVRFDLDHYAVNQDSTADDTTQLTSVGAVELAWPLSRRETRGAVDLLVPRVQLVLSDAAGTSIPNEESTLVEFDEGALWALDRLPGATAYEAGNRINAGMSWTRRLQDGREGGVTVGRVFRQTDNGQFNKATGLSGTASDWLVAGHLTLGPNFSLAAQTLFDADLSINRGDVRLGWERPKFALDANFLWHIAEPEVGRELDTWELHSDARFALAPQWEGSANMRYDFAIGRAAAAGLGLSYRSRCVTADLGLTRSFTSSDSAIPKTEFTITLSVPTVDVASTRPALQCGG